LLKKNEFGPYPVLAQSNSILSHVVPVPLIVNIIFLSMTRLLSFRHTELYFVCAYHVSAAPRYNYRSKLDALYH